MKKNKLFGIKILSIFFLPLLLIVCDNGLVEIVEEDLIDPYSEITVLSGAEIIEHGSTVDFGYVTPGQSEEISFYIKNTGKKKNLNLTGDPKINIDSVTGDEFSVTTLPNTDSIEPDSQTIFTITFNPAEVGDYESLVSIVSDADSISPYRFYITGSVTDSEIEISDTNGSINDNGTYDIGSVKVGQTMDWTFSIENSGTTQLALTGDPLIEISGTDADSFEVVLEPEASIESGYSSDGTIRFSPDTYRTYTADITIRNNDPDDNESVYEFTIEALGLAVVMELSQSSVGIVNGGSYSFETLLPDDGSDARKIERIFTIENAGTESLDISDISLSDGDISEFSLTETTPLSIPVGNSDTFTLTLDVLSLGAKTAEVTITYDDSGDDIFYTFDAVGTGGNILTAENGQSHEYFGRDVDISGDYIVVGASGYNSNYGKVYVFKRDSDTYTEIDSFQGSDTAAVDWFGAKLAMDGDYIICGTPKHDDETQSWTDSGKVYVFKNAGDDTYSQTAEIVSDDIANSDYFGSAVDIEGSYAVIGSMFDDENGNASGSAYIFKKGSGEEWTQMDKLVPSVGQEMEKSGYAVAISGDYVLVGQSHYYYDSRATQGSVYVFKRNADETWSETAILKASDGAANDRFGEALAIADGYAIIGALPNTSGAAYVFKRNADESWTQVQKIVPDSLGSSDSFGSDVSIYDDYAVIGASFKDIDGTRCGAAYIFKKDTGDTWNEIQMLYPENGTYQEYYGYAVAISTGYAVVGAFDHEGYFDYEAGAAFVYEEELDETWSLY